MGKIETYAQMSARHQQEYNEFAKDHVHYAFGKEQLAELLADALRRQGLDHEAAGAGVPRVQRVVGIGGQIDHVGLRVDLLQGTAEVETAGRSQFNIQYC